MLAEVGSLFPPAPFCDGIGSCLPGAVTSCGAYECDGVLCRTSCTLDAHCITTHFCDTVNAACTAKYATGHSCTANVQCISGTCTSGYCV